ncbi:MAG TPA: helix-hairpin-helix domain-containing protein [Candidatus Limnocylindrales bacterium]|nr:helix-hairpin-helix domain-containing protein [Candidatus Limnocylindrales bacterium]
MGSKGEAKSGKACLLLSLIVLVWNVAATGRHFLFAGSPHPVIATPFESSPSDLSAQIPASARAMAGPPGPLTVKQNFLLGKKVDINRASLAEIEGLPGISRKVAESVIETRNRQGGFRRFQDLLQVKGIKEKRLKKILPFLVQFPNN